MLLQNITNISDNRETRRARLQAEKRVKSHGSPCAPRGNPEKGAKMRHDSGTECKPNITLTQLLHDRAMMNSITENMLAYMQRNVSLEMQKAIAITIMVTAMAKWGCSVVEAASHAADCTDFSKERMRKWAFAYINSTPMATAESPDDECVTGLL